MIRVKGNIPEQLGFIFSDYLFNYKYKDEIKERLLFCFEQLSKQKFEELTYSDYMNWFFKNCIIENNEMTLITKDFFTENKDRIFYNMMPIWYKEKKDMLDNEKKCIITLSILFNIYEKTSYEEVLYLNCFILKNLEENVKEFINNELFNISTVSFFENPFSKQNVSAKVKSLKNKLNKVKVEEIYYKEIKDQFNNLIQSDSIWGTNSYQKEKKYTRKSSFAGYETSMTSTCFETVPESRILVNFDFCNNNRFKIKSILLENESKEPFLVDDNLNIVAKNLRFSNIEKEKILKQVASYIKVVDKIKSFIKSA